MYIPDKHNTHLKDLIIRWRNNPLDDHQELADTIDKIIKLVLGKKGAKGWARNFDSSTDLLPSYRVDAFRVLSRVNTTKSNKEIYSFLVRNLQGYNKNKRCWSVTKNLKETKFLKDESSNLLKQQKSTIQNYERNLIDNIVYFSDEESNQLSNLILDGYTVKEAANLLEWSNEHTKSVLDKLKLSLNSRRYSYGE